jgi:hypothetical protein
MPSELFDEVVAAVPQAARVGVRAEFPSGGRWRFAIVGLAAGLVIAVGIGIAPRGPLDAGVSGTPSASPPLGTNPSTAAPSRPAVVVTPAASPRLESNPPTDALSAGEWHRNNYNAGEERLVCQEGTGFWTCDYLVPDGTGSFIGQLATESWTCPEWFPRTICDNVTAVYRGYFAIDEPPDGRPSETPEIVPQEYVITKVDGQQVLQLYWIDRFVCPWYRTFEAALASDYECVVTP